MSHHWFKYFFLFFAAALGGGPGHAATFTVESAKIPGLTARSTIVTNTIRLSGPIEGGDAERLRAILVRLKAGSPPQTDRPLATVELSSSGGDVHEGLKLGHLFRDYVVATVVRPKDLCLSACALAFLGGTSQRLGPRATPGRSIEIGGQVGFHNFYLNANSDQIERPTDARDGVAKGIDLARGGAAALTAYAAAMEIDAAFIASLLGRSPEQWQYIDADHEFASLQTCPIGLEAPRLGPQALAANICNHSTGWFSVAAPAEVRQYSAREGKRHLLEQVAANIDAYSVKGPLAAQLKAVLAARDDRLVEDIYDDLRRAGITLPQIPGSIFEILGPSNNVLQLHCHVAFPLDNPAKFEVTLQTPEGLIKPVVSPPAQCPALFLYDRDDVLNPRR